MEVKPFGLALNVASDDLFVPALVGLINKTTFVVVNVVLALVVSKHQWLADCTVGGSVTEVPLTAEEDALTQVAWAFLAINVATLLHYAWMLQVATRGTPVETEKRSAAGFVVVILQLYYVAEVVVAVLLTVSLSGWPDDSAGGGVVECPRLEQKRKLLIFSVTMVWLDLVMYYVSQYFFLHGHGLGRARKLRLDERETTALEWESCFRTWCGCFRVLSCNLFGFVSSGQDADHTYRCVAEVFTAWFSGTGISVSDLLCALVLVRADQKKRRLDKLRFEPADARRRAKFRPLKKSHAKTYKNVFGSSVQALAAAASAGLEAEREIAEPAVDLEAGEAPPPEVAMAQFRRLYDNLPFMLALYGWKLMLYADTVRMKPFGALRKLLSAGGAGGGGGGMGMGIGIGGLGDGDNCLNCSTQALLTHTALDAEDIIYATFASVGAHTVQVPHAVMVDNARRQVVVALRGTLSLQDLMTDAQIEPMSIAKAGAMWGFDGAKHHAHEGMMLIAMKMRATLEHNGVLHKLLGVDKKTFEASHAGEAFDKGRSDVDLDALPDCAGYDLVVVGHSLGAGVAALLTLMLRPTFPEAACLAYAGPGAVMSYNLAEESAEWCTNVFLGYDIVPRLNWSTLSALRDHVMDVLWRAKVSKARILRSALTGASANDLMYEAFEVPKTESREAFRLQAAGIKSKRKSQRLEQIPMFAPGVIIHLAKVETVVHRRCLLFTRKERVFEPHWVRDRREMNEPVISSRSLFDHFPDLLPAAMKQVLMRYDAD